MSVEKEIDQNREMLLLCQQLYTKAGDLDELNLCAEGTQLRDAAEIILRHLIKLEKAVVFDCLKPGISAADKPGDLTRLNKLIKRDQKRRKRTK